MNLRIFYIQITPIKFHLLFTPLAKSQKYIYCQLSIVFILYKTTVIFRIDNEKLIIILFIF